MCVTLIGGMDRAKNDYKRVASRYDITLKHFERECQNMKERLGDADAIIIFTNRISHSARNIALSKGKERRIPVFMCHSCGISSLKRCLDGLVQTIKRGSDVVIQEYE